MNDDKLALAMKALLTITFGFIFIVAFIMLFGENGLFSQNRADCIQLYSDYVLADVPIRCLQFFDTGGTAIFLGVK